MSDSVYFVPVEQLEAASAAWLRDLEEQGRSPHTIEAYASTLADFTSFFGADEDKPDVPSYAEVLLWRGNLESRGCRDRTIAQYLRQLRAFFNRACKHGWYENNPVQGRLIPSVSDLPPKEYITLHDWQLQRLYTFNRPQNAKTSTYPRNYAVVILLLTTNLRNAELLRLTPADLHWSDNAIIVRDGHAGEVRRVAFSDLAQSAVRLYLARGIRPKGLADTEPLFGTTSEKGVFGTQNRACGWSAGSPAWLSALVERHVLAVAFVHGVRCEELRYAAAQAESLSLAEARARQARRNVRLLEQIITSG